MWKYLALATAVGLVAFWILRDAERDEGNPFGTCEEIERYLKSKPVVNRNPATLQCCQCKTLYSMIEFEQKIIDVPCRYCGGRLQPAIPGAQGRYAWPNQEEQARLNAKYPTPDHLPQMIMDSINS